MYFPSKRIRRIVSWLARVGLTYIMLSVLIGCAMGQPTSSISPSAQPTTPARAQGRGARTARAKSPRDRFLHERPPEIEVN